MKRILVAMISFVCLLAPARAQTTRDTEGEIRDLEQQRFRAMEHVDVAALNRILSDDLIYTHASRLQQTKAEMIGVLGSGEFKYESISVDSTQIRIYDQAAVVTGRATMKIKSGQGEQILKLCYLDVYAMQDGRWQMVAWQSSRVEP
ncbi:MAG: nuclear transport factor 2 family protein [Syntrophobacteraceae bacterium]